MFGKRNINHPGSTILILIFSLVFVSSAWAETTEHDGHSNSHSSSGHHFSKPLITIYPNVANEFEVKYLYLDEKEAKAHEAELEFGYIVAENVSVELKVPYMYHDPDGAGHGSSEHESLEHDSSDSSDSHHRLKKTVESASHSASESGIGNVVVGLKLQNDALAHSGVTLGYGLAVALPTGDSEKGIGSDKQFSLQPFYSVGYQKGSFQAITSGKFITPLNSPKHEEDDSHFNFGTSLLYAISKGFRPFVEIDGEVALEGTHSGDTVVNVSPGMRYELAHGVDFGAGVGFPLTNKEEFDFRAIASLLIEFS